MELKMKTNTKRNEILLYGLVKWAVTPGENIFFPSNRNCSALNKYLSCLLFFQARQQSASLPIQFKQWPDLEESGGRTLTAQHPQSEECAETQCYSGIVEAELTTLADFSPKATSPRPALNSCGSSWCMMGFHPWNQKWFVGPLSLPLGLTPALEVGDILL